MSTNVKDMMAEANAVVPRIDHSQARNMMPKSGVLVVDVRDAPEIYETGKIKGAINVSRGMLEFRADPDSPAYNSAFQKDKTVMVYCGSGGRAALAGKTLKDLGYGTVLNLGAFKDLIDAGFVVESGGS